MVPKFGFSHQEENTSINIYPYKLKGSRNYTLIELIVILFFLNDMEVQVVKVLRVKYSINC
jgi:hypothetical protein